MTSERPVVLLVDDDADMRYIGTRVLAEVDPQGRFAHLEAEDGEQAVAVAKETATAGRPLLILCDYRMVGMDGIAVARALLPLRQHVPLRFLLLTSMGMLPRLGGSPDAAGVDGILEKGFHPHEWRDQFRRVLDEWAAALLG